MTAARPAEVKSLFSNRVASQARTWAPRALPIVAAVLISGCGGEGSGQSAGLQDRLSHEELDRAASEICDRIDEQVDALPDPQSEDEYADFLTSLIALSEKGIADLNELQPPTADEATYEEMIGALESAVRVLRQEQDVITEGDLAALKDLNIDFEKASADFDRLARELDLSGCGQSVDS